MTHDQTRAYQNVRDARRAKEHERDLLGRTDVPVGNPYHLATKDPGVQRAWHALDAEIAGLRAAEDSLRATLPHGEEPSDA